MNYSNYPTNQSERELLADELSAKGFKPTQAAHCFDRDKISRMIEAMRDDSFDWYLASLQPIILGPNGEILGGHHRIIAAHLAGIDLNLVVGLYPQIQSIPVNFRPVYDWIDVLPDVL